MHRRAEAEKAIRHLALKWMRETDYRPKPGWYPSFYAPPELTERIDAWAAKQKDAPSRSEAIRRLLEKALGKART